MKIAWFYCKRLQNDGALNFVQFFSGPRCIMTSIFTFRVIGGNVALASFLVVIDSYSIALNGFVSRQWPERKRPEIDRQHRCLSRPISVVISFVCNIHMCCISKTLVPETSPVADMKLRVIHGRRQLHFSTARIMDHQQSFTEIHLYCFWDKATVLLTSSNWVHMISVSAVFNSLYTSLFTDR